MARGLFTMTKKAFYSVRQSKQQLQDQMVVVAKQAGVKKIAFNTQAKKVRGTYNAFTGVLFVCLKQTKKEVLNTFFHELGHHCAVKNKKWNKYHFNLVPEMDINKVFDIENGVDKIANKLWNEFVDIKQWGKYKFIYSKKQKNYIIRQLIENKLA